MWYSVKEASELTQLTVNQIYYRIYSKLYVDNVKHEDGKWQVSHRFIMRVTRSLEEE